VRKEQLGLCNITYGGKDQTEYDKTLEDVLSMVADNLKGRVWNPQQWADLVVIGETGEHRYVLNNASEEAIDKLATEYGGRRMKVMNVSKARLWRVTVRNMKISGRDSIILEAFVRMAESPHGYCMLFPTYLNVGLHELDMLISTMMKMKMIKLSRSKGATWLHEAYKRMPIPKD